MTVNKPSALSIANALAFGLNTLETAGVGPFSSRFSSGQDNASISEKYQTIITPRGIAFAIWALIFLSEAIFVGCVILSPRHMKDSLVVNGVSFWFIVACIAQTAWSPAFAYEKMLLSVVFMGCILAPLVMIVEGQYNVVAVSFQQNNRTSVSWKDYLLLQFPFELHLGWIAAAFALNVNVLVVASGATAKFQLAVGGISLAILTIVSIACLLALGRPQYTFPLVATWATFWISQELRNPNQLIKTTFSSEQIESFRILAFVISTILAATTIARWLQRQHCVTKRGGTLLQDESGEDVRLYSSTK